jgi:hypothetical protein
MKFGVNKAPVLVSSSEIDIVDAIGNSFDRATVFVDCLTTGATMTLRFMGRPNNSKGDWFQIGDDVTQEPLTKKAYASPDLFVDFKVRAVRAGTDDGTVRCWTIWEPKPGQTIKNLTG